MPGNGPVAVGLPVVDGLLDVHRGLVHDPVRDALEPVVEPAVDRVHPHGAAAVERVDVALAQDPQLARHVARLEPVPPLGEVVRAHVLVLDAVRDEHAGLDLVEVLEVVADGPEVVVVAGDVVLAGAELVAHRQAVGAAIGVRHGRGEALQVVVTPLHDAVGARVVVIGRDRGDRDDRAQPLDAGGRDGVGQRAVVGLADQAGLAVVPRRLDLDAVLVDALRAAVEPVDDDLRAEVVGLVVDGRAAGRVVGPDHVHQDHGVAARDEVVVVEQRPEVEQAVAVEVALELGLVAAPERRVVRARVHDHRRLQALVRGLRALDVDRDDVLDPVLVGVVGRFDEDALADRVRVAEHGLGLAARGVDDRRALRLRLRGAAKLQATITAASPTRRIDRLVMRVPPRVLMRVLLIRPGPVNRTAASSGTSRNDGRATFDNCRYVGPQTGRTLVR